MAYYRCEYGHLFRRTPSQLGRSMRTKCGRCGKIVEAIPCPEAQPPKAARRNPFAPSILRQRKSRAEWKRRQKTK